MRDPRSHAHDVRSVNVEETHFSKVFLTGTFAYKIKKAVNLGFLDFSTLEKRRHYCRMECALNQRLSNGVYVDVVPITREEDDTLVLGGSGVPVEYAVRMRQLADDDALNRRLVTGRATDDMLQRLAARLAAFYTLAERGEEVERYAAPDALEQETRSLFDRLDPFVGPVLRPGFYEQMRQRVSEFVRRRRALFERRIDAGRVREGHGDLRPQHVYLTEDDVQIIDCIEFNRRFRCGDVAADLASLAMELEYLNQGAVGRALMRDYAQMANDPEVFALLDFYRHRRALVRAKLSCLALAAGDPSIPEVIAGRARAERYFELAHRYARVLSRPTLWVACGPVASGKTTVAKEIGHRIGVEVRHSDAVRKELFGIAPGTSAAVPLDQGIYTDDATARTYDALAEDAGRRLARRESVVLDATWSSRQRRVALTDMGRRLGANVIFLECRAPVDVLRERLSERGDGAGASDARLGHLETLLDRFEPLGEVGSAFRAEIDTARPTMDTLIDVFDSAQQRQESQAVQTTG